MDLTVLIPDRNALDDVIDAHARYDDPNEPLILSSMAALMGELS